MKRTRAFNPWKKFVRLTCILTRQGPWSIHLHPRILTRSQINRVILDFDFEKVCSVSLSNINIYGCLVCGKYFQGRGRKSYAYAHSIHEDHHVFINLETTKVNYLTRLKDVLT
jgi:hypothetical protein